MLENTGAAGILGMPADRALDLIFKKNGMVSVKEICEAAMIGERQLENLFKKYIGLSPEFFSGTMENRLITSSKRNETP